MAAADATPMAMAMGVLTANRKRRNKINTSVVIPISLQLFNQEENGVKQEYRSADRDDTENNPFGDLERRAYLQADKKGKPCAVNDHN